MFTPTDTSSTPPPTKTHTHSLALISCLAHRCLAPRAMLTSIRHTPSPLQFRSWSGFTFLFCDIWSEALSQLHTSYKRNTQNDVNVKAAPVWTLYLYVVLVLCVPVTNSDCVLLFTVDTCTHTLIGVLQSPVNCKDDWDQMGGRCNIVTAFLLPDTHTSQSSRCPCVFKIEKSTYLTLVYECIPPLLWESWP